MNEALNSINLPKQILDKAEKVLSTLLGPSAREIGEMFADRIRYKRLKNQVSIFSKTADLLEKNNLQARELNLKTLVPLIELSSLEDDEILQKKWANLIANISSTAENGLEPKLVKTLSNLSSLEARVLDYVHERFLIERQNKYEKYKASKNKYLRYNSIEEVKIEFVTIKLNWIKERFNLNENFAKICIDNLEALGLISYEEPEVEIENTSRNKVWVDEGEQYVDLDDIFATYNSSDDFNLTAYGNYFINQCKMN